MLQRVGVVNYKTEDREMLNAQFYHKIEGINSDSSREQMLNAVQQHFASQLTG